MERQQRLRCSINCSDKNTPTGGPNHHLLDLTGTEAHLTGGPSNEREAALLLQWTNAHRVPSKRDFAEEIRQLLKQYGPLLGSGHPCTLGSVDNLASLLQVQGQARAAEEMHGQMLNPEGEGAGRCRHS